LNLIEIIKACGENAVTRLEYEGVKIDFAPVSKTFVAPEPLFDYNNSIEDNDLDPDVIEEDFNLEEIKLSDPLAYEKYLLEGSEL